MARIRSLYGLILQEFGVSWRSEREYRGIPLVAVGLGPVAVFSFGVFARGIISVGVGSIGILSFGVLAVGVATLMGVESYGALVAIGVEAHGIVAFGVEAHGVIAGGVVADGWWVLFRVE